MSTRGRTLNSLRGTWHRRTLRSDVTNKYRLSLILLCLRVRHTRVIKLFNRGCSTQGDQTSQTSTVELRSSTNRLPPRLPPSRDRTDWSPQEDSWTRRNRTPRRAEQMPSADGTATTWRNWRSGTIRAADSDRREPKASVNSITANNWRSKEFGL